LTQERLLSWIFYSVALATELDHAGYSEISIIADGINNTAPSNRELKDSVEWLIKNGLVEGRRNNYKLTSKGREIYERATRETKLIPEVWNNLERRLNEQLKSYAPPSEG